MDCEIAEASLVYRVNFRRETLSLETNKKGLVEYQAVESSKCWFPCVYKEIVSAMCVV